MSLARVVPTPERPSQIAMATTPATDSTRPPMSSPVVPGSAPFGTMSAHHSSDPMDIVSPTNNSGSAQPHPPSPSQAPSRQNGQRGQDRPAKTEENIDRPKNSQPNEQGFSTNISAPPPAAAAVHQPKIVQTAFIHKLYNMLEDPNIQHLISWSTSSESFVMSPSADFSKVLSQYFKHTNISSFVRQLNMYGFHKERDVFHTGSPDAQALWEFKHGNGNFKRGDLAGLREIKRRASRHALTHRENNHAKQSQPQQSVSSEPVHFPHESADVRLQNLELAVCDMSARLQRAEENAYHQHAKNQGLIESMARLLQINHDLTRTLLALRPSDSGLQRDVLVMQSELQRQAEAVRGLDDAGPDPGYGPRQPYVGGVDNAPVSPRQMPRQDESRRSSLATTQPRSQNFYRPTIPSNLTVSARRPYGSIGSGGALQSSPLRNAAPPPPSAAPHPLSNVDTPFMNTGRRHTSADIRGHGWPAGAPSGPHPSSPGRIAPEDQRIRDSLSNFSLQTTSQGHPRSRPSTPPPPHLNGAAETFGSWSWSSAASRESKGPFAKDASAPPTRRGSMAHILNPPETSERSDEDDNSRGDENRKRRKRMQ